MLPGTLLLLAALSTPDQVKKVDALFAESNRADTPGYSVAVIRDGRTVLARGHGMADLERDVRITPRSVFDIGSTSKQFTAAAILLLEQEGKLTLDDDVRKHIPELRAYERRAEKGYVLDMSGYHVVGDGGVYTTTEDLAKWDANFYEPKVGGPALLEALHRRGRLQNGEELDYAAALVHGTHNGRRTVSHGGAWAGYRADMVRFPEQRLTVIERDVFESDGIVLRFVRDAEGAVTGYTVSAGRVKGIRFERVK